MAILQALTSALAQSTTRAEVGVAAVDAVSRMYDVRSAFLAVVVRGGDELEIVADRGLPQAVTARWRRIPLDSETAVADAIRDRQPVLLRTLDERRHRYPSAAAERELIGGGGAMALPLMLGSSRWGRWGSRWPARSGSDPGTNGSMRP